MRCVGPAGPLTKLTETEMAVQQNRKTPSKRGMRRAHDRLSGPTLSADPTTGEVHRRHHVSPDGFYRGKRVLPEKASETEE